MSVTHFPTQKNKGNNSGIFSLEGGVCAGSPVRPVRPPAQPCNCDCDGDAAVARRPNNAAKTGPRLRGTKRLGRNSGAAAGAKKKKKNLKKKKGHMVAHGPVQIEGRQANLAHR